jgi:hypothetical protein
MVDDQRRLVYAIWCSTGDVGGEIVFAFRFGVVLEPIQGCGL